MMSSTQFVHSVKVPRLYKIASKVVKNVSEGRNFRNAIEHCGHPNKKKLVALVMKTLQHRPALQKLFEKSQILTKEDRLDNSLAEVLTTELLWGNKSLIGESKPVLTVLKYKEEFMKYVEETVEISDSLNTIWRPRYVRVNTIVNTPEEVIKKFEESGWKLLSTHDNYTDYIDNIRTELKENNFIQDVHMKELLAFPFGTLLTYNSLLHDGSIFLMDKASCMVTHVLRPEPGSIVLDMCAAPGMKTTHLAAYMNDHGCIYAIERDEERYKILKQTIALSKATCIQPVHRDAFKITNKDFPQVDYILLDPSCSGSGMLSRLDYDRSSTDSERLNKLSNMQSKLLRYALTMFPTVKRVVYSTCSLNKEENENVVEGVMTQVNNFKVVNCPRLFSGFREAEKNYIRLNPFDDCTSGFFIAAFDRIENSCLSTKSQIKGENDKKDNGIKVKTLKDCPAKSKKINRKRKRKKIVEEITEKKYLKNSE